MIAEFAMRDARRPVRILARPRKLLATMDWLTVRYNSYYQQPADLERYFEENPTDLLILHSRPPTLEYPHERLLETAIHDNPEHWKLIASVTGHDIYQFTNARQTGEPGITPLFRSRVNGRFDAH